MRGKTLASGLRLAALSLAAAAGLAGCAPLPPASNTPPSPPPPPSIPSTPSTLSSHSGSSGGTGAIATNASCTGAGIRLDSDFPAGNIASCSIAANGNIAVTLSPENAPPINCSPWYAFRLHSQRQRRVEITLNYTECGHRYWPKTSADGQQWEYVPETRVRVDEFSGKKRARISLDLGKDAQFVSAQEIFVSATYDTWITAMAQQETATRFELGQSAEKRPISGLKIGNPNAREQVVLAGRQHPPEVTGALAMLPFVETVMGDTSLAQKFRERFQIIAVPLINPDGVEHGFWRHNTGGVDLNRDWGPFTQPETALMGNLLRDIDKNPDQNLRLLLDFHSTQKDVFYSIPDELPTNPSLFTRDWLARYQQLMPAYHVNRDARHEIGRPVSKAYAFDTYQVPAVTFEIGDETDRILIRKIGEQSAIAMMETLLATPAL